MNWTTQTDTHSVTWLWDYVLF